MQWMHRQTSGLYQEIFELPEGEKATRVEKTRQDLRPIRHQLEQIPRRLNNRQNQS